MTSASAGSWTHVDQKAFLSWFMDDANTQKVHSYIETERIIGSLLGSTHPQIDHFRFVHDFGSWLMHHGPMPHMQASIAALPLRSDFTSPRIICSGDALCTHWGRHIESHIHTLREHAHTDHPCDAWIRVSACDANPGDAQRALTTRFFSPWTVESMLALPTSEHDACRQHASLFTDAPWGYATPDGPWIQVLNTYGDAFLMEERRHHPSRDQRSIITGLSKHASQSMGDTLGTYTADMIGRMAKASEIKPRTLMQWLQRFPITAKDLRICGLLASSSVASCASAMAKNTSLCTAMDTILKTLSPSDRSDLLDVPLMHDIMVIRQRSASAASVASGDPIQDEIPVSETAAGMRNRVLHHLSRHGAPPTAAWIRKCLVVPPGNGPHASMRDIAHGIDQACASHHDLSTAVVAAYARSDDPVPSFLMPWLSSMATVPADRDRLWHASRRVLLVETDRHAFSKKPCIMPMHGVATWTPDQSRLMGESLLNAMEHSTVIPYAEAWATANERDDVMQRADLITWIRSMRVSDRALAKAITNVPVKAYRLLDLMHGDKALQTLIRIIGADDMESERLSDVTVSILGSMGTAYPTSMMTLAVANIQKSKMFQLIQALQGAS